jgi:hypothetical protein
MSTRQEFENIYNEFRTLELNKEYYARRIEKSRKVLRALDIFLALFAGGSGVLGFGLWTTAVHGVPIGPILLSLATGVALVLGIARPYLKLEDEHERISSIQGTYGTLAFVMEDVVRKIKTARAVDETSQTIYEVMRLVRATLRPIEDPVGNRKLVDEMQKIVNQRHPVETFYYPPDAN